MPCVQTWLWLTTVFILSFKIFTFKLKCVAHTSFTALLRGVVKKTFRLSHWCKWGFHSSGFGAVSLGDGNEHFEIMQWSHLWRSKCPSSNIMSQNVGDQSPVTWFHSPAECRPRGRNSFRIGKHSHKYSWAVSYVINFLNHWLF